MEQLAVLVCSFACWGGVLAVFALPVAWQANRRGYSMWLWLLVSIIVINPIIFLVTLALMPNRARKKLRIKFQNELDEKLAQQPVSVIAMQRPGMPTVASTLTGERSLGDLPTMIPHDRSVGDDETRG